MDFWTAQRDLVQGRIAEIEGKLAQQRQLAQQVHARGADATVHIRLINILKEGVVREKAYAQYIDHRIVAHEADADKRTSREALISKLTIKPSRSVGTGAPPR
jgi:hypothetical protein